MNSVTKASSLLVFTPCACSGDDVVDTMLALATAESYGLSHNGARMSPRCKQTTANRVRMRETSHKMVAKLLRSSPSTRMHAPLLEDYYSVGVHDISCCSILTSRHSHAAMML